MICNMGFYQTIRKDITGRWMRLKDLQNKQKIKLNVSLFPTYQNGSKLGRQEHLHPHCFIQDHHQNHMEGYCKCYLFHCVLFR